MLSRRLVLASTSPYRRALLARLELSFDILAPGVDERPLQERSLRPEELVRELSIAKAAAVAADCGPESLVIGSDQCAELDGVVLGKPGSPEKAREQLAALSGRTHRLLTGVCLHDCRDGTHEVHVEEHRLTMRKLDAKQIAHYVEVDSPLSCAGAYRIEALGVALFEKIEGSDSTAIVGLPLMALVGMLARRGFDVLSPLEASPATTRSMRVRPPGT